MAPEVGLPSHLIFENDFASSKQSTFMFFPMTRYIVIIFINDINQLISATGNNCVLREGWTEFFTIV